jgi:hypothetical protein
MPSEETSRSSGFFARIGNAVGDKLAAFLSKPSTQYRTFSTLSEDQLTANLQPGDLILVEGNSRISSAIKYLTQSTWSHVAVYIGEHEGHKALLEADLVEGVITVPLNKYNGFNLRICRPVNLSTKDTHALINYFTARIGHQYDTKNIFDLMRFLLPTPPIPQRFRRRLLEFGSGDPTKAICSTLVAQAFQSIRYPILPLKTDTNSPANIREKVILAKRHYSHFTPRDFDLSPYFEIIKPTLHAGFNYQDIVWTTQSDETA